MIFVTSLALKKVSRGGRVHILGARVLDLYAGVPALCIRQLNVRIPRRQAFTASEGGPKSLDPALSEMGKEDLLKECANIIGTVGSNGLFEGSDEDRITCVCQRLDQSAISRMSPIKRNDSESCDRLDDQMKRDVFYRPDDGLGKFPETFPFAFAIFSHR